MSGEYTCVCVYTCMYMFVYIHAHVSFDTTCFTCSMIVCIGAALLAGPQLYYIALIYLSITSTYFMVCSLSYHHMLLRVTVSLDTIPEVVIAA